MSLWAFLLIVSLLVKQTYLYFPQPRDVKVQKFVLIPEGFAFAERDLLPRIKMADWCDVTGMGETVKGMTAIHWTADGEEGIMWLHLKDPGLSYVAFERLIDYFVSNPGRRRVLGTKDGVDVVRALLRGAVGTRRGNHQRNLTGCNMLACQGRRRRTWRVTDDRYVPASALFAVNKSVAVATLTNPAP